MYNIFTDRNFIECCTAAASKSLSLALSHYTYTMYRYIHSRYRPHIYIYTLLSQVARASGARSSRPLPRALSTLNNIIHTHTRTHQRVEGKERALREETLLSPRSAAVAHGVAPIPDCVLLNRFMYIHAVLGLSAECACV